jgi:hypothetical protein
MTTTRMTSNGQRIMPLGPARAYQTYSLACPPVTHFRAATCAEVDCAAWVGGWVTRVDALTSLGAAQARYITERAGRPYRLTEHPETVEGGERRRWLSFAFPAGQRCFAEHRVPLEREPLLVVRGGDWRRKFGVIRRHTSAEDWRDDFASHLDMVRTHIERG